MEFANKLVLNSGFVFDYTNMLGEGRIKTEDLQEMETAMQKACDAVNEMRAAARPITIFQKMALLNPYILRVCRK